MPVKEIAKTGHIRPVSKGTVIFREHDRDGEMYIVLQGMVELSVTDARGQKIKQSEVSQGGFFGEMSLLTGQPRKASAVTSSDSMLMVITQDNFDAIISKKSSTGAAYHERIGRPDQSIK